MSQINPSLPAETVKLDSFNLIPGATFMLIDEPDPRVWVAERVERDANFERVFVWAWDATRHNEGLSSGLSQRRAFDLHYCAKVALVGIIVNPDEVDDDTNWGAN